MKHTPFTSTATPRDDARSPQPPRSTFGEMLGELIDLSAGFAVALLPLFLLSVPAIILFFVLPVMLLLALAVPLAAIGAAIAAPPYLLARWLGRRRRRTASPPAEGLTRRLDRTFARPRRGHGRGFARTALSTVTGGASISSPEAMRREER
jgi:hypothetical protein